MQTVLYRFLLKTPKLFAIFLKIGENPYQNGLQKEKNVLYCMMYTYKQRCETRKEMHYEK